MWAPGTNSQTAANDEQQRTWAMYRIAVALERIAAAMEARQLPAAESPHTPTPSPKDSERP